jgi:hypothetical protein
MSASGRGSNGGEIAAPDELFPSTRKRSQGGGQRPASDGQTHDRRDSCGGHQLEGELPARLEERHGEAVQDRPHDEVRTRAPPTARKTKANQPRNETPLAFRDSLDGVHDPRLRPRVTYDGGVDLGGIGSPNASVYVATKGEPRAIATAKTSAVRLDVDRRDMFSEIRERCSERALLAEGRPLGRLQSPARHERDGLPAPSRPRASPHAAHRRGGRS